MLESIEKLRTAARNMAKNRNLKEHEECNLLLCIANEIEAEISESYVLLPVDADGIPIHVGDMMKGVNKYDSLQEITGKVVEISSRHKDQEYITSVAIKVWAKDMKSWHVSYLDPRAEIYHHVKEHTVEDVLREMIGMTDQPLCEEDIQAFADEIRELLRGESDGE